jgi:hypothetical protein
MTQTPFVPFGNDASSFINSNLAGKYLDSSSMPTFRYGVGGVMNQPNNAGFLPGATTVLPTSPEQPPVLDTLPEVGPQTDLDKLLDYLGRKEERQRAYEREDLQTIREMSREANRMGQWNTIMGSVLKDLPRNLSEQYRRSNMYIGDMLKSQADAAREQSVGIRQAISSMPGAPARNYIRI